MKIRGGWRASAHTRPRCVPNLLQSGRLALLLLACVALLECQALAGESISVGDPQESSGDGTVVEVGNDSPAAATVLAQASIEEDLFDPYELPPQKITALDPEDFRLPTGGEEMLRYLVKDYVQPETEISLEEAIAMALTHNHDMNSTRLRAAAACAGVDVRWADLKPQISLQSRVFTSFDNGGSSENSESDDSDGDLVGTLALNLTQRIHDFGRTRDSVEQAEALHAIQKYVVDQAEQQLVHNVVVSYIAFNLALGRAKVRDDEVRLSQEFLRQARVQFEVGVVPRLDVLRAEARLEEANSSFILAQAAVGDAAADFFALLGVEDQRYVPAIVTADFVALGMLPPDLNEAITLGLETRPEIEVQYSTLFSEQSARELTKNRPILEAYASSFLRHPDEGFQATASQEIGVQLRWDIYSGGRDKAQRREIDLNLASISEGVLELETQVERDVTKSWNRLVAARSSADSARKNLELSAESLRVASIGYRAGVTPYIDFIDAFDSNVEASLAYIFSLSEVRLAHVNLARAQGFPMGYPGDTRADVAQVGGLREILGLEGPSEPAIEDPASSEGVPLTEIDPQSEAGDEAETSLDESIAMALAHPASEAGSTTDEEAPALSELVNEELQSGETEAAADEAPADEADPTADADENSEETNEEIASGDEPAGGQGDEENE